MNKLNQRGLLSRLSEVNEANQIKFPFLWRGKTTHSTKGKTSSSRVDIQRTHQCSPFLSSQLVKTFFEVVGHLRVSLLNTSAQCIM